MMAWYAGAPKNNTRSLSSSLWKEHGDANIFQTRALSAHVSQLYTERVVEIAIDFRIILDHIQNYESKITSMCVHDIYKIIFI